MASNGILFILTMLVWYPHAQAYTPVLARQPSSSKIKEIAEKIHNKEITLDELRTSHNAEKNSAHFHEPFLVEVAKHYYLTYGTALQTRIHWGFSIQELHAAGKLPKIEKHKNYVRLNLSKMHINNLEGLQHIPEIGMVTDLELQGNKIEALGPYAFASIPNLRALNLNDNAIHTIALNAFAGLRRLRVLNLNDNKIKTLTPYLFATLNSLEVLNLNDNKIRNIEYPTLSGLKQLKILGLAGNKITTIDPNPFIQMKQLEALLLGRNLISTIPTDALAGLVNLKFLDLCRSKIKTVADNAFAKLHHLQNVSLFQNPLRKETRKSLREKVGDHIILIFF